MSSASTEDARVRRCTSGAPTRAVLVASPRAAARRRRLRPIRLHQPDKMAGAPAPLCVVLVRCARARESAMVDGSSSGASSVSARPRVR